MEKRLCSIYCITNLINNKQYIGSTIAEPNIRFNQHKYNAFHENVHQYNYPLYQAIRKYGLENFKFDVIYQEKCTEEKIREIEQQYIIKYNTISPNGYNQTLDTKHPINDIITYQKISETKRENAKKIAEVDINNNIIKIWRSIVDCAEDTCLDERKIAAVCRGERHSTNNRYFKWIDDNNQIYIYEYKGDNYKGEKGTTQIQSTSRKVAKIDPKTNKIIEIYPTIALASRENNCDASGISKACRGLRKINGGFCWKYIDE